MSDKNVIFIGGPDSGKTNYLIRLWVAMLADHCGEIKISSLPKRMVYIEGLMEYFTKGEFAERTRAEANLDNATLTIPVTISKNNVEIETNLFLPDVKGELWQSVVETFEISKDWMDQFEKSNGIVIFLRPQSELNCFPLDYVNAGDLIEFNGHNPDQDKMPTQVMLCEFIRLAEAKINKSPDSSNPRLSIILTGWDAADTETIKAGPIAYLNKEFPLFAAKIRHLETFDVAVFATSVFGGDPKKDVALHAKLMENGLENSGYIIRDTYGNLVSSNNFFLPIEWALGS